VGYAPRRLLNDPGGAQLLKIEHIDSAFGAPRRFHFWRSAVSSRPGFFFADECLEAGLRTISGLSTSAPAVALRIPHGKGGTQAAIDWLSDQVKA